MLSQTIKIIVLDASSSSIKERGGRRGGQGGGGGGQGGRGDRFALERC